MLISDVRALLLNGTKVLVKDGTITVGFGGFTNAPVMSGQKLVGVTKQGVHGSCGFTTAVEAGTDLRQVFEFDNGQIRAQLDSGDEWMMTKASNENPADFSGGAGDLAMTYIGTAWVQTKLA